MQAGQVVNGRYRLEQPIGSGGMGAVWRARDLSLDIPVAVKFMSLDVASDPQLRARFEREAKAAARLRSPHVVQTTDYGVSDEVPFLVMELLVGEDLGEVLRRRVLPPLETVVRIADQICRGLQRAHQEGIIHRDLKPANIFLSAPDDGLVKLLDFGVAKTTGIKTIQGETTTTGQLLGSPAYMSPEQSRGGDIDARSDLWSVAVILYRLTTGKKLFPGDDMGDVIVRISMDPIAPPSSIRPELPRALDDFFVRALCRDREGRFASAAELAAAFTAAALPAAAHPAAGLSSAESRAETTGPQPPGAPDAFARAPEVTPSWQSAGAPLPRQHEPTPTPLGASATHARAVTAQSARSAGKRYPLLVGATVATVLGVGLGVVVAFVPRSDDADGGEAAVAAQPPIQELPTPTSSPSSPRGAAVSVAPSTTTSIPVAPTASASVSSSATAATATAPSVSGPPRPSRPPRPTGPTSTANRTEPDPAILGY